MAKKKKLIVSEGQYSVTGIDGKKHRVKISADDIEAMASTGKGMLEAGLRIPAPWKHDLKAVPVEAGKDPADLRPEDNAGFWEDFKVVSTKDGRKALEGILDAVGDENDPKSPAYMVGKNVRDTSIYFVPKYRDGKGREWDNALMHVAVCQYPIEPGQENFEDLPSEEESLRKYSQKSGENFAIAMSSHISDEGKNPYHDVPGLLDLLGKAGITLPEDTDESNIMDRLKTALMVVVNSKSGGSTNRPPKGSEYPVMPVFMSSLTDEQVKALVGANITNPATGKPFAKSDFTEKELPSEDDVKSLKETITSMSTQLTDVVKVGYQDRINALIKKGVLSPEKAAEKFAPMIEGVAMHDGVISNPSLDAMLDLLEDVKAPTQEQKEPSKPQIPEWMMSSKPPEGAATHTNPTNPDQMSEKDDEEIVKSLLGHLG